MIYVNMLSRRVGPSTVVAAAAEAATTTTATAAETRHSIGRRTAGTQRSSTENEPEEDRGTDVECLLQRCERDRRRNMRLQPLSCVKQHLLPGLSAVLLPLLAGFWAAPIPETKLRTGGRLPTFR